MAYCESLRLNANKAADNYLVLENAALKGLSLVPASDAADRARFFFFAAFGNYYQVKFDSAQYYFYQSLYEAQKAGSGELMSSACVALIPVNFQLRQQQKVDSCKNILQTILDTTHNTKILQDGYSAMGSYYQQKSYYSTAQDYLLKSVELRKKVIDTTSDMKLRADYAIQCYLLSKQYQNTELPDKALDVLKEGLPYSSASPLVAVRYLSSFTEIYAIKEKIDSAIKYEKLLDAATKGSSTVPSELISANMNIAKYYLDHQQPAAALQYVTKADTLATKSKSPILLYQAQMIKGRYFQQTGKYKEAIGLFEQSLPVAAQISREQYTEELKYMALAQKGNGDIDKAWKYNEDYIRQSDSLNNEKISLNFADQETRYQTRQKEEKIGLLGKENQLQVLQLQAAANTKLFLMSGLVALVIITLLMYFIYRNKANLNEQLNNKNEQLGALNRQLAQANETKAKLFGIIGHDLRAPAARIVQLLQLQKDNPEMLSGQEREKHEQRLKTASENVLGTMEDLLLWSKSQMQHFSPQFSSIAVYAVIEKETDLLTEQLSEKKITVHNNIDKTFIRHTDENFISVIVRNLLQNAIKYGDPSSGIIVTNNSSGISITNKSSQIAAAQLNERLAGKEVGSGRSGLGLQIAADLARAIGVTIYYTDETGDRISASLAWERS